MESKFPKIELTRLKCLRCNYEWYPRKPIVPKTCPACHSPLWNKPRKRPVLRRFTLDELNLLLGWKYQCCEYRQHKLEETYRAEEEECEDKESCDELTSFINELKDRLEKKVKKGSR